MSATRQFSLRISRLPLYRGREGTCRSIDDAGRQRQPDEPQGVAQAHVITGLGPVLTDEAGPNICSPATDIFRPFHADLQVLDPDRRMFIGVEVLHAAGALDDARPG